MNFPQKFRSVGTLLALFALGGCGVEPDRESSPGFFEESDWGEIGWEEMEQSEASKPINHPQPVKSPIAIEDLPSPPREFRAAWVATVHNLDWPSKPGLPVHQLKAEAIAMLDRLVELNMNAVIFQVRPDGDALYQSDIEPWSYYLTGKQGVNQTGFDPLEFWVKESHARGIHLHAWFNPYRVYHSPNNGPISDQSILKTQPEVVVKLKRTGYWWMDPGSPKARAHTLKVVLDVVARYDIDGVHFDDYFYPYPAYNHNRRFPDAESYRAYRESGVNWI